MGKMVEASVAVHSSSNAEIAAREVTTTAMGRLRGDADLAIVFMSDHYRTEASYTDALLTIKKQLGEQTPIVGCIAPVVFASDEMPTIHGAALMLLRSKDIKFMPLAFPQAKVKAKDIAKQMAKRYLPYIETSTSYVNFMFGSGPVYPPEVYISLEATNSWFAQRLTPIFSPIFRFLGKRLAKKGLLGPTNYIDMLIKTLESKGIRNVVGGNSIHRKAYYAYEFFNTEVMSNSIISCLLASNKFKFGIGWSYGATPTGRTITVDKALSGGVILGANRKGGQQAILETTGISKVYVEKNLAKDNYALLHHLLGVKDKDSGEYYPYITAMPPDLDSALSLIPDRVLKSGIEIEILIQSGEDILKSVAGCLNQATADIQRPEFAIIFECMNRALALGDKILREDDIIKENLGVDVPYIGFGGGGEFCNKPTGFHYVCSTIHALVVGT